MPGRPLESAPRSALFGKLPAHGDFVRRGDPAWVERLDAWLSGAVEQAVRDSDGDADRLLAALPTWCFRLPDGLAGALIASEDKVGRLYPLVACGEGIDAGATAALLLDARDRAIDADALAAALPGAGQETQEWAGWWRLGSSEDPLDFPDFPTGDAVVRLWPAEAAR